MSDLLDQLITPEVRMVLYLMLACVVMLYVLSIVYVIRDAQRRGAEPWWLWGIISVVPIVGLLAYVILRPSSYLVDREEQDLDIALREHQLSHYGICPKCGTPIDKDFVVCPVCNTQVRNVCPTCHRPLNADWKVCPYCRTRILFRRTQRACGRMAVGDSDAHDRSHAIWRASGSHVTTNPDGSYEQ